MKVLDRSMRTLLKHITKVFNQITMTKDELIALMNDEELRAVQETQDIEKVDVISVLLEYMNQ